MKETPNFSLHSHKNKKTSLKTSPNIDPFFLFFFLLLLCMVPSMYIKRTLCIYNKNWHWLHVNIHAAWPTRDIFCSSFLRGSRARVWFLAGHASSQQKGDRAMSRTSPISRNRIFFFIYLHIYLLFVIWSVAAYIDAASMCKRWIYL